MDILEKELGKNVTTKNWNIVVKTADRKLIVDRMQYGDIIMMKQ